MKPGKYSEVLVPERSSSSERVSPISDPYSDFTNHPDNKKYLAPLAGKFSQWQAIYPHQFYVGLLTYIKRLLEAKPNEVAGKSEFTQRVRQIKRGDLYDGLCQAIRNEKVGLFVEGTSVKLIDHYIVFLYELDIFKLLQQGAATPPALLKVEIEKLLQAQQVAAIQENAVNEQQLKQFFANFIFGKENSGYENVNDLSRFVDAQDLFNDAPSLVRCVQLHQVSAEINQKTDDQRRKWANWFRAEINANTVVVQMVQQQLQDIEQFYYWHIGLSDNERKKIDTKTKYRKVTANFLALNKAVPEYPPEQEHRYLLKAVLQEALPLASEKIHFVVAQVKEFLRNSEKVARKHREKFKADNLSDKNLYQQLTDIVLLTSRIQADMATFVKFGKSHHDLANRLTQVLQNSYDSNGQYIARTVTADEVKGAIEFFFYGESRTRNVDLYFQQLALVVDRYGDVLKKLERKLKDKLTLIPHNRLNAEQAHNHLGQLIATEVVNLRMVDAQKPNVSTYKMQAELVEFRKLVFAAKLPRSQNKAQQMLQLYQAMLQASITAVTKKSKHTKRQKAIYEKLRQAGPLKKQYQEILEDFINNKLKPCCVSSAQKRAHRDVVKFISDDPKIAGRNLASIIALRTRLKQQKGKTTAVKASAVNVPPEIVTQVAATLDDPFLDVLQVANEFNVDVVVAPSAQEESVTHYDQQIKKIEQAQREADNKITHFYPNESAGELDNEIQKRAKAKVAQVAQEAIVVVYVKGATFEGEKVKKCLEAMKRSFNFDNCASLADLEEERQSCADVLSSKHEATVDCVQKLKYISQDPDTLESKKQSYMQRAQAVHKASIDSLDDEYRQQRKVIVKKQLTKLNDELSNCKKVYEKKLQPHIATFVSLNEVDIENADQEQLACLLHEVKKIEKAVAVDSGLDESATEIAAADFISIRTKRLQAREELQNECVHLINKINRTIVAAVAAVQAKSQAKAQTRLAEQSAPYVQKIAATQGYLDALLDAKAEKVDDARLAQVKGILAEQKQALKQESFTSNVESDKNLDLAWYQGQCESTKKALTSGIEQLVTKVTVLENKKAAAVLQKKRTQLTSKLNVAEQSYQRRIDELSMRMDKLLSETSASLYSAEELMQSLQQLQQQIIKDSLFTRYKGADKAWRNKQRGAVKENLATLCGQVKQKQSKQVAKVKQSIKSNIGQALQTYNPISQQQQFIKHLNEQKSAAVTMIETCNYLTAEQKQRLMGAEDALVNSLYIEEKNKALTQVAKYFASKIEQQSNYVEATFAKLEAMGKSMVDHPGLITVAEFEQVMAIDSNVLDQLQQQLEQCEPEFKQKLKDQQQSICNLQVKLKQLIETAKAKRQFAVATIISNYSDQIKRIDLPANQPAEQVVMQVGQKHAKLVLEIGAKLSAIKQRADLTAAEQEQIITALEPLYSEQERQLAKQEEQAAECVKVQFGKAEQIIIDFASQDHLTPLQLSQRLIKCENEIEKLSGLTERTKSTYIHSLNQKKQQILDNIEKELAVKRQRQQQTQSAMEQSIKTEVAAVGSGNELSTLSAKIYGEIEASADLIDEDIKESLRSVVRQVCLQRVDELQAVVNVESLVVKFNELYDKLAFQFAGDGASRRLSHEERVKWVSRINNDLLMLKDHVDAIARIMPDYKQLGSLKEKQEQSSASFEEVVARYNDEDNKERALEFKITRHFKNARALYDLDYKEGRLSDTGSNPAVIPQFIDKATTYFSQENLQKVNALVQQQVLISTLQVTYLTIKMDLEAILQEFENAGNKLMTVDCHRYNSALSKALNYKKLDYSSQVEHSLTRELQTFSASYADKLSSLAKTVTSARKKWINRYKKQMIDELINDGPTERPVIAVNTDLMNSKYDEHIHSIKEKTGKLLFDTEMKPLLFELERAFKANLVKTLKQQTKAISKAVKTAEKQKHVAREAVLNSIKWVEYTLLNTMYNKAPESGLSTYIPSEYKNELGDSYPDTKEKTLTQRLALSANDYDLKKFVRIYIDADLPQLNSVLDDDEITERFNVFRQASIEVNNARVERMSKILKNHFYDTLINLIKKQHASKLEHIARTKELIERDMAVMFEETVVAKLFKLWCDTGEIIEAEHETVKKNLADHKKDYIEFLEERTAEFGRHIDSFQQKKAQLFAALKQLESFDIAEMEAKKIQLEEMFGFFSQENLLKIEGVYYRAEEGKIDKKVDEQKYNTTLLFPEMLNGILPELYIDDPSSNLNQEVGQYVHDIWNKVILTKLQIMYDNKLLTLDVLDNIKQHHQSADSSSFIWKMISDFALLPTEMMKIFFQSFDKSVILQFCNRFYNENFVEDKIRCARDLIKRIELLMKKVKDETNIFDDLSEVHAELTKVTEAAPNAERVGQVLSCLRYGKFPRADELIRSWLLAYQQFKWKFSDLASKIESANSGFAEMKTKFYNEQIGLLSQIDPGAFLHQISIMVEDQKVKLFRYIIARPYWQLNDSNQRLLKESRGHGVECVSKMVDEFSYSIKVLYLEEYIKNINTELNELEQKRRKKQLPVSSNAIVGLIENFNLLVNRMHLLNDIHQKNTAPYQGYYAEHGARLQQYKKISKELDRHIKRLAPMQKELSKHAEKTAKKMGQERERKYGPFISAFDAHFKKLNDFISGHAQVALVDHGGKKQKNEALARNFVECYQIIEALSAANDPFKMILKHADLAEQWDQLEADEEFKKAITEKISKVRQAAVDFIGARKVNLEACFVSAKNELIEWAHTTLLLNDLKGLIQLYIFVAPNKSASVIFAINQRAQELVKTRLSEQLKNYCLTEKERSLVETKLFAVDRVHEDVYNSIFASINFIQERIEFIKNSLESVNPLLQKILNPSVAEGMQFTLGNAKTNVSMPIMIYYLASTYALQCYELLSIDDKRTAVDSRYLHLICDWALEKVAKYSSNLDLTFLNKKISKSNKMAFFDSLSSRQPQTKAELAAKQSNLDARTQQVIAKLEQEVKGEYGAHVIIPCITAGFKYWLSVDNKNSAKKRIKQSFTQVNTNVSPFPAVPHKPSDSTTVKKNHYNRSEYTVRR